MFSDVFQSDLSHKCPLWRLIVKYLSGIVLSFHQKYSKKVIKKAQKGDRFALTQIYELYKSPVFHLAYQMLRDEHRANDVLQTVMLKMMNTISNLADTKKFNGWLKRITYNTVIDTIRANQKLVDVGDESEYQYSAEEISHQIDKPDWDLEQFLDVLNERERIVVWLYAIDGYTHSEVAQSIGVSEQNSRIIFSRAMKSLKSLAADPRYSGRQIGGKDETA
ncbi:sigma-70 family RNA polymerase sigma factor [Kangiella sp. HD9-110m-PIT-SAG07]|nr:sigma-70 family RNA polymerase sigma factor [Kangiella sp. HD9-110m-PIT-SAG07]